MYNHWIILFHITLVGLFASCGYGKKSKVSVNNDGTVSEASSTTSSTLVPFLVQPNQNYLVGSGDVYEFNGHIYTHTWINGRIQKFDLNGKFVETVIQAGLEDEPIKSIVGWTPYASRFYVAANDQGLAEFTTQGRFLRTLIPYGLTDSSLEKAVKVVTDGTHLYIIDWGDTNKRLKKFTMTGNFVSYFDLPAGLTGYANLTIAPSGNFLISGGWACNKIFSIAPNGTVDVEIDVDRPYGFDIKSSSFFVSIYQNKQIREYDYSGTLLSTMTTASFNFANTDRYYHYQELSTGNYILMEEGVNTVVNSSQQKLTQYRYHGDGAYMWRNGSLEDGQVTNGRLTISDWGNDKVKIYDNNYKYIDEIDISVEGINSYHTLYASNGKYYVADYTGHRIGIYNADLSFDSYFGSSGSGDDNFSYPFKVYEWDGKLYIADAGNDRVKVHNLDGSYVTSIGASGSGDGQIDWPAAVARDNSGNFYIVDRLNKRVAVFDSSYTFVRNINDTTSADTNFENPWGIAIINEKNQMVVTDSTDHGFFVIDLATDLVVKKKARNGRVYGHEDSFRSPFGVTYHEEKKHIIIFDTGNARLKYYDENLDLIYLPPSLLPQNLYSN